MGLFLNRHKELRSGWRLALFVLLTAIVGIAVAAPLWTVVRGSDALLLAIAVAALGAGSWLMTRFVNRKPFTAIGLSFHPGTFRELGIGCLAGFLMMTAIVAVEYVLGYASPAWCRLTVGEVLIVLGTSSLMFFLGAAVEELAFRGYYFQTLIQGITFLPATIAMAGLFGAAHLGNPNVSLFGIVNFMLAGIWLSIAYIKTRGLWLPLGLHFSWNFTQATIFGLPTSGIDFADKRLLCTIHGGPAWLTGGAFGPEGGILTTLALLAGTGYILKSRSLAVQEGIITLDSLEDLLPPAVSGGNGQGGTQ
jgi:membrane protease YdiL (CAAX protease family)